MAQTARNRSYFARKAAIAKRTANGGAAPTARRTAPKAANDNRLYGANLGRSMTVAVADACIEAAGFEQHASY